MLRKYLVKSLIEDGSEVSTQTKILSSVVTVAAVSAAYFYAREFAAPAQLAAETLMLDGEIFYNALDT